MVFYGLFAEWIHGFYKHLDVHPVDHDEVHRQVCGVGNEGARHLLQLQTCCCGHHHRRGVLQVRSINLFCWYGVSAVAFEC